MQGSVIRDDDVYDVAKVVDTQVENVQTAPNTMRGAVTLRLKLELTDGISSFTNVLSEGHRVDVVLTANGGSQYAPATPGGNTGTSTSRWMTVDQTFVDGVDLTEDFVMKDGGLDDVLSAADDAPDLEWDDS